MITTILSTAAIIGISYFIGSISSSILICKTLSLTDPRDHGSKNPGATNVFRIAGYKLALSVALFDILKGAIPMYLGLYFKIHSTYLQIIAIFICIGHMYPIFYKFYGGKGVATTFGVLIAVSPNCAIIMIILWILIVLFSKYVSLGSIITTIITPCYIGFTQPTYLICTIILSCLILIRHHSNIKRLLYHQERQI